MTREVVIRKLVLADLSDEKVLGPNTEVIPVLGRLDGFMLFHRIGPFAKMDLK
jgi:hypothetical protein